MNNDLQIKREVSLTEMVYGPIPEWQKDQVRKAVKEVAADPSILIDEEVVFNMLRVRLSN